MDKGLILVTGGAGYIGSHVAKRLLEEGLEVLVLDNFSCGFLEPLSILKDKFPNLSYIKIDLSDRDSLAKIFHENNIATVFHLAAKTDVAESMKKPDLYYRENYLNGVNLVEIMSHAGVKNMIFSSTAAVYGNPKYIPIDEKHPVNPTSPYGKTKLDFEKYLCQTKNINYVVLRYFNVGGSDQKGLIGKSHVKNNDLIGNIMKVALGQKDSLEIYGNDYDTKDGTAVRDFVHVEDVVQAHVLAMEDIQNHSGEIFNLASESGFSIKEIVDQASEIFQKEIPIKFSSRRPGDIVISRANASKAKKMLGWVPENSNLQKIIQTDWNWRKAHPFGYTK